MDSMKAFLLGGWLVVMMALSLVDCLDNPFVDALVVLMAAKLDVKMAEMTDGN